MGNINEPLAFWGVSTRMILYRYLPYCTLPCASANIRYLWVWRQFSLQQKFRVYAVAYELSQEVMLLIQSGGRFSQRSRRSHLYKACGRIHCVNAHRSEDD